MAIMYAAVQLALYLGVEEKSRWQQSWEIVTGGGLGLLAGLIFFCYLVPSAGCQGWALSRFQWKLTQQS